jgi:hypothetical protein
MIVLIDEKTLNKLVEEFLSPRAEFDGKSYVTRRREWFDKPMQNIISLLLKESLENLTMENAMKIYNEMTVGGPKLYTKTYAQNGIEKIRNALAYLLHDTSVPLDERFFNVVSNPDSEYRLQGVGRAFASTALLLIDLKKYAIWNGAIDEGLKKLGLLPRRKREENVGQTYVKVVEVLKQLQSKCGFEDLSVVDEFVELIFHERLGTEILKKPPPEPVEEEPETKEHTKFQWMLIKIGILQGYDVWVAQNDRNKEYSRERLGDLCLGEIPHFAGPEVLNIAKQIDVIWFKKGSAEPIRFFEVEHSTSIYSGLLRLNDVKVDYPINKANIVGPKKRNTLFDQQIDRRTFKYSKLKEICSYLTYEDVEEWFEAQKKIK